MIEVRGLRKNYGAKVAVDDLSFTVRSGQVTGFLGPNGAGKTTTMRMILGLDTPSAGIATVRGKRYVDLPRPMRTLGALIDAKAVHPSRTAYNHLLCLAQSNGLPKRRVAEVLGIVGLDEVAGKRAGKFSLGMSQRLGIAGTLLGDPEVLMFDEPVNGLDPEGIRWIRQLMRRLAGEGRTVLVSSHLMSEMALTADHLIVIGRGKLVADSSLRDFVEESSERTVLVRTPFVDEFARLLLANGADVRTDQAGVLIVSGMDSIEVGKLAAADGVVLAELTPQRTSLEEAFMELTRDSVEYNVDEGVA
ncbi:ATP-binding cassette domain-containing protein [Actinocrispum wychmicini]|uniref:ABC-2 type transport system ATP-binding protein n=1 Tax=Actinocrispum wychmicini TaxID=1213861 RepID=A0A4R2JRY1_9PSEU|nr:ATP-binding cassette domain-containing protein [Actinocrispum wychmicini]TCO59629.1 ABC-2 type transport system ATP-binding protein [Actinocrispum wychmicini]